MIPKRLLGWALLASVIGLLSEKGQARTFEGVEMPDKITVQGRELLLNGMGIRKATFLKVKVYVAGLYLAKSKSEMPVQDAEKIVNGNEMKQVLLQFTRKIPSDKLMHSWDESFAKNCKQVGGHSNPKENCDALKPFMDQLRAMMEDVKAGDRAQFTFTASGVEIAMKDHPAQQIKNSDFAKVLLLSWLGPEPPTVELKDGMLGKVP